MKIAESPRTGRRALRLFMSVRRAGYWMASRRRRWMARAFEHVLRKNFGCHVTFQLYDHLASENAQRWSTPVQGPIRLSIVVVSYKQPMALRCLLSALACQVLLNFEVLVYHDGPDADTAAAVAEFADRFASLRYHESAERANDWGHSLREKGLQDACGDFVLLTNGDNYYVPRFTEFVFDAIDQYRPDMVLWDMVHSYSSPGRSTLQCYTPLSVFPARYMVDIGSVMVRTELARRVGFSNRSHSADASYVESILGLEAASLVVGKIPKCLVVHN